MCIKHCFVQIYNSDTVLIYIYILYSELCYKPRKQNISFMPFNKDRYQVLLPACNSLWFLLIYEGFQYFSSVPVLHYLQAVLFIKIWTIFMNILYVTLFNIRSYKRQFFQRCTVSHLPEILLKVALKHQKSIIKIRSFQRPF
jgi:hypothetical protein